VMGMGQSEMESEEVRIILRSFCFSSGLPAVRAQLTCTLLRLVSDTCRACRSSTGTDRGQRPGESSSRWSASGARVTSRSPRAPPAATERVLFAELVVVPRTEDIARRCGVLFAVPATPTRPPCGIYLPPL
jgi:hypothetical protein